MALHFKITTKDKQHFNSKIEYPNGANGDASPAEVMLYEILQELKKGNKKNAAAPQDLEMLPKKDVVKVMRWLLGYTDFPQQGEREGIYYWRTHLRDKIKKELGIEIKK